MSWKETITCSKFDAPISIPEQDRVKISVLQKPFEEVIYNRLLRLSFENWRNYCRISYSGIQDTTSLRSKNAVITGIQGLIEKRHIIKLLNDDGKPEMNREGTLYRVLSPEEALRGVLDDGTVVSEIDREGMYFIVVEKNLPGASAKDPLITNSVPQNTIMYAPQGNINSSSGPANTRVFQIIGAASLAMLVSVGTWGVSTGILPGLFNRETAKIESVKRRSTQVTNQSMPRKSMDSHRQITDDAGSIPHDPAHTGTALKALEGNTDVSLSDVQSTEVHDVSEVDSKIVDVSGSLSNELSGMDKGSNANPQIADRTNDSKADKTVASVIIQKSKSKTSSTASGNRQIRDTRDKPGVPKKSEDKADNNSEAPKIPLNKELNGNVDTAVPVTPRPEIQEKPLTILE